MNYSEIKYFRYRQRRGRAHQPVRVGGAPWVPGCFQPRPVGFHGGKPFSREVQDRIVESLAPEYVDGLSLLGGEPMEPENQRALVDFVTRVEQTYPGKSIWCYTAICWMTCAIPTARAIPR